MGRQNQIRVVKTATVTSSVWQLDLQPGECYIVVFLHTLHRETHSSLSACAGRCVAACYCTHGSSSIWRTMCLEIPFHLQFCRNHTHSHAHARTPARTQAPTHTRTHTHTHTHTNTHIVSVFTSMTCTHITAL